MNEISLSKPLKKDFSSHFHVIKYEVNFIQMAKKQNKDEESNDDTEESSETESSESEGAEFDEDENLEEETEEKGSDEYEEW